MADSMICLVSYFAVIILALLLCNPSSLAPLRKMLEHPDDAPIITYAAKAEDGAGLDCLKVVEDIPRHYLGVHHVLRKGIMELRLVESSDLTHWRRVITIDSHAHQGTLKRVKNAWLLAYEKDGKDGNWIHISQFPQTTALRANLPSAQIDLPRHLSKFAEGTPCIIEVAKSGHGSAAEDLFSQVFLTFHYYKDGVVDQEAQGVLNDFSTWSAKERSDVNRFLSKTYRGNLGDRDTFQYDHHFIELLEGQLRKNDWRSWRILIRCEGSPFEELRIRTRRGSVSFANPSASEITLPNGRPGLVITYFLPNEGAAKGESGELVYAFPFPGQRRYGRL